MVTFTIFIWILAIFLWIALLSGAKNSELSSTVAVRFLCGPVALVCGILLGFGMFWDKNGRVPFFSIPDGIAWKDLVRAFGHDMTVLLLFIGLATLCLLLLASLYIHFARVPGANRGDLNTRRSLRVLLWILQMVAVAADILGILAFYLEYVHL